MVEKNQFTSEVNLKKNGAWEIQWYIIKILIKSLNFIRFIKLKK